jgi:hypothetical protein
LLSHWLRLLEVINGGVSFWYKAEIARHSIDARFEQYIRDS